MAHSRALFIIACCAVSVQSNRVKTEELLAEADSTAEAFSTVAAHSTSMRVEAFTRMRVDGEEIRFTNDKRGKLEGFKCGATMDTTATCYPRAYKGWTESGNKAACSSQCTMKEGRLSKIAGLIIEGLPPSKYCKCPNKGEKCSDIMSNNPGVDSAFVNGMRWTGPIKVEIATGKWQFLTSEEKWEGSSKVKEWKWVYPEPSDNSFVDHTLIATPAVRELTSVLGADTVGENPDFCDAALAAQYIIALENL